MSGSTWQGNKRIEFSLKSGLQSSRLENSRMQSNISKERVEARIELFVSFKVVN